MSFTVNYTGKSKDFSCKHHAMKFMDQLDCGSDLWICNTLLRSRVKQADGSFTITQYMYPGEGPVYTITETRAA